MTKARLEFIKSVALRHKQIREGDKPITPGETKTLGYIMEGVLSECIEEIERIQKENLELCQTLEGNGMMILKEEKTDFYNDRLDIIEVDY